MSGRVIGFAFMSVLTAVLTACVGLAGEPRIVSTVIPQSQSESVAVGTLPASSEPAVLGAVVGQVRNGTAGAATPGALSLTLHVIQSGSAVQTFSTTTDAAGAFRFDQVPFASGYRYMVVAPYSGVPFSAEADSVDPAHPELTLPVAVYESGALESAIRIASIRTQIVIQDKAQIAEIVSLVNNSDRAYWGSSGGSTGSVRLRLPSGASLVDDGTASYSLSRDGQQIVGTRPLLPGFPQVLHLTYAMPYESGLTFDQILDYPLVGSVDVLFPATGFSLIGDGFVRQEDATSTERSFARYSGSMSLAAGAHLRYALQGAPSLAQPFDYAALGRSILVLLVVVDIVALGIAGMVLLRKRRVINVRIGALVEQIAALDAQGQAGQLDPEDYERERLALKTQLKALMKVK